VVDINKDGTKDFPHGVVVEAILRAFLPGTEVLRFGSATTTIPAELVVEQFRIIRAAVLGGRRIDAVNLSLGWNMPLHILRRLTGVDGLSPDSLQRDVPAVRRWALADTKFPNLAEALRAIEQVTALGVPVYVAAGNKGSHFANLFCFAEGVVPVAATCRHGHVLPSSAESSICVWAEGRFGVRRVPGGYDLNFSGEPDLPLIPGGVGPLVVEQWADKPVHDVVTTHPIDVARMLRARRQPQEVPLSDPLRAKLFDVEGVARQGGLEPEELERMRRCGSRFIDFSGRLRFRERAGRIVYDPGNSGESGAIGVVRGTSFAAPVALAHDWKARHC
jgi:hypothetical protein